MIAETVAASAAQDQSGGWAHLFALIAAALLFWAGSSAHKRWKKLHETPSPTGGGGAEVGAKPQARAIGGTNGTTSEKGSSDLEVFVAANVGKVRTTDLVKQANRRFGKSRRTVLRAITKAKGAQS